MQRLPLNIARMPSDCPITGMDTASARARETLGIARAVRRARSVADSLSALVCAICGRIVWLRHETPSRAEHAIDVRNPDSSLRSRWIYDFLHGRTYDVDLTNLKPDRIEMRGYQGINLLGTTLHLFPAPAELPNCLPSQSDPSQERAK